VFLVEHANHFVFLNHQDGGGRDRGGRGHANMLASEAGFAEEIAGAQNRYHGFPARFVDYRELHAALLKIHDVLGGIALGEDGLFSIELGDSSAQSGGVEKLLHIENAFS